MSQNLNLVKRFFENRNQDDLETYLSFIAPDAEFDFSELERPYRGIYRGRERIEELYHYLRDPWQESELEIEEPVAIGDRVVVTVTRTVRAQRGLEVRASATAHITLRDGKIAAFKVFPSRPDALRAAGLPE
jgi:ketosteroid isomerase-like protein